MSDCLSVCLCVRPSHTGSLFCLNSLTYPQTFPLSDSHTIQVFPRQTVWQYSDVEPPTTLMQASNARGILKKLRKDTSYGYSYSGMRIGNLTQAFEW